VSEIEPYKIKSVEKSETIHKPIKLIGKLKSECGKNPSESDFVIKPPVNNMKLGKSGGYVLCERSDGKRFITHISRFIVYVSNNFHRKYVRLKYSA